MLMLRAKQYGGSLVELMISMALGFASLTAMSSLVSHGIGLNNSLMAKSRLDEEIHSVATVINQELKRAGYNAQVESLITQPSSFINYFDNSLVISAHPNEAANSCISFRYDRNQNGKLDALSTNEQFGFRLRDHAIEIRVDDKTCSQGYWQDLTDPQVIKVTNMQFKLIRLTKDNIEAELVAYPLYSTHLVRELVIKNHE